MSKFSLKLFTLKRILKNLFCILLIASAILFAADKSPNKSLFGYRWYAVLSNSMQPEFSAEDMIIVKVNSGEEYNIGDVVTFNPGSDAEVYVTHRITQKLPDYEGSGITRYITKGDAVEIEDGYLLASDNIIGRVIFHIPKLGKVSIFVVKRWYIILAAGAAVFFVIKGIQFYISDDEDNVGKEEK